MHKNLFIALEGIDGSGKSTQAQLLAEGLRAAGHKVYLTFEPTDNPIGRMIREIFRGSMQADHRVIAGLFVADRLHHILHPTEGLLQKLAEGYTVVTDRYLFSSYAYQGVHVPLDWVIQANSLSASLLRADLHIYIDVPPEESLKRIAANRTELELYETLDNLQQVAAKYQEAFGLLGDYEEICMIDGNRPADQVAADVLATVLSD
jgi:dTMP kinase